ncbi:unnamed protein product [Amoebophrya sp. A25]|nr:unnamed protein product [Amoebophrya sp. A25]|eukprot:GSA25T00011819001.1
MTAIEVAKSATGEGVAYNCKFLQGRLEAARRAAEHQTTSTKSTDDHTELETTRLDCLTPNTSSRSPLSSAAADSPHQTEPKVAVDEAETLISTMEAKLAERLDSGSLNVTGQTTCGDGKFEQTEFAERIVVWLLDHDDMSCDFSKMSEAQASKVMSAVFLRGKRVEAADLYEWTLPTGKKVKRCATSTSRGTPAANSSCSKESPEVGIQDEIIPYYGAPPQFFGKITVAKSNFLTHFEAATREKGFGSKQCKSNGVKFDQKLCKVPILRPPLTSLVFFQVENWGRIMYVLKNVRWKALIITIQNCEERRTESSRFSGCMFDLDLCL